jgi:hypothetical protein
VEERRETYQREFLLSLRLEVSEDNGAMAGFIITQKNGVTALRAIGLAKVGFKRSGAIITLGRKANSAEFIEKREPKRGPFISESRDIIKTFIRRGR